ncbi:hypothetical protein CI102_12499 [Trichoderma harzianum]|nr:hypothetical protein CI102_12499 [Trichoderma harzianum]
MARYGETEGEGEICACKRWDATCGRRHKGKSARIGGRCRAIASIEAWRERQRRNWRKESGGWRVGSIGPVGPLDLALTDGYLFFFLSCSAFSCLCLLLFPFYSRSLEQEHVVGFALPCVLFCSEVSGRLCYRMVSTRSDAKRQKNNEAETEAEAEKDGRG